MINSPLTIEDLKYLTNEEKEMLKNEISALIEESEGKGLREKNLIDLLQIANIKLTELQEIERKLGCDENIVASTKTFTDKCIASDFYCPTDEAGYRRKRLIPLKRDDLEKILSWEISFQKPGPKSIQKDRIILTEEDKLSAIMFLIKNDFPVTYQTFDQTLMHMIDKKLSVEKTKLKKNTVKRYIKTK